MEQQYKKSIIILFVVLVCFCVVTTGYFLFAIGIFINHSDENLKEVIIETAQEEMKRVVDNVIVNIENKKINVQKELSDLAETMASYIKTAEELPFVFNQDMEYIRILIEEKDDNEYAKLYTKTGTEQISLSDTMFWEYMENSPVYVKAVNERQVYHMFVEQSDIDAIVKKQIHDEIHQTIYGDEMYVWVNEIINFDGGDDYAVRVIHPNLADTEGSFLSTDMTDMVGGKPYQAELEGIKKDGEIIHTYYFKRLRNNTTTEKLSYAKLYEPYQWIIATGRPVEDMMNVSQKTSTMSRQIALYLISISLITQVLFLRCLMAMRKKFQLNVDSYVKAETELDSLTGALSRKAGQAEIQRFFEAYEKDDMNCMLLMIDVDNFKTINDTYGHDIGDLVLCQIVKTLLANIRENDRLIRWGGDEFVLLCKNVELDMQPRVAEKILNCIRNLKIEALGQTISVTLSIGYSDFEHSDNETKSILVRADEALYCSKKNGRNQFTGYEQIKKE